MRMGLLGRAHCPVGVDMDAERGWGETERSVRGCAKLYLLQKYEAEQGGVSRHEGARAGSARTL